MSRFLLTTASIVLGLFVATVLFAAAIHAYRRGDDTWAGFYLTIGLLAVAQVQDVK